MPYFFEKVTQKTFKLMEKERTRLFFLLDGKGRLTIAYFLKKSRKKL